MNAYLVLWVDIRTLQLVGWGIYGFETPASFRLHEERPITLLKISGNNYSEAVQSVFELVRGPLYDWVLRLPCRTKKAG